MDMSDESEPDSEHDAYIDNDLDDVDGERSARVRAQESRDHARASRQALNIRRWSERPRRYRKHDNMKRPIWEPRVHRSSEWIEDTPATESNAMDCLLRQGCQCPPKHYSSSHVCLIPGLRLECLREIHRWQQYRHIVEIMANKLPKELVLEILEYVAIQSQPRLHLQHKRSLSAAARSIIGDSPMVDQLQPIAEEAILNTSLIELKVTFQGDQKGKVAVLDPFVSTLPHPIRYLELPVHINISFDRQQYPAALYIASAGMKSLLSQMPRLHTIQLMLCISLSSHPRDRHRVGVTTDFLNISCRKGFSGATTFKNAIIDLLDAARAAENGPDTSLELRYEHPDEWRAPWRPKLETYRVEAGARPALEVVEEAEAKHQW